MRDRLIDALKGAVELNLRYSSVVLNLSKEYIKDIERIVRASGPAEEPQPEPQPDVKPDAQPEAKPDAKPTPLRRAPILLVGELNEVATGAFALNNTSDFDINLALAVQGELDPALVEVTPARLVVARGDGAFVRLKVRMVEAIEVDRDYLCAVVAPGVSSHSIEFVVRRLASAGADKASGKA
jgi:hypothetical protein